METPVLSVTEISLSLKACVEQVFSDIKVRGEVSTVKRAPSGHIYFSLKDKDSVLSAVCWRGRDKITTAAIEEGLEVICTGKLSTYPGRSNYQMIVENAEPAGVGALLKLLNDRKEKLEKEGLFDASGKKPLPFIPTTIGVITSPTGAVIQDIMHRLNDRFPRTVLLWPVLVQGDGASAQITAAINGFNAIPFTGLSTPTGLIARPDVLIVARGGGSLEDLWCFNEENVVRAAAASTIPLISAVGHETDTTLIDYASDRRAPTPTAAAEYAVPVKYELITRLNMQNTRLTESLFRYLSDKQTKIMNLTRAIPNLSELINTFIQKVDDRSERLQISLKNYLKNKENQFVNLKNLLKSYSYQAVLQRGFTVVSDAYGKIITSAPTAKTLSELVITFADGKIDASVITPSSPHPCHAELVSASNLPNNPSSTPTEPPLPSTSSSKSTTPPKSRKQKTLSTDQNQWDLFEK